MRPAFLASAFASSSRRWNMMVFSFYVSCLSSVCVRCDDFCSSFDG